MAARLRAGAPAGALLLVACLFLATAAAVSGARPLAVREEGSTARAVTVESPAGDAIRTVVRAVERRLMFDVGMLRGIKDSGPSPGAGH
ncbi:hypothetical protein CFC21_104040 [Triticum aestivum]|uniref:Uncharacterized protein n=2 Tax=Triticum aestivum TaxID=4565 RepID=A0A9R1M989_WHEAT|nr:hypothetical protein CFC21_104040 [Triticum aestivum]